MSRQNNSEAFILEAAVFAADRHRHQRRKDEDATPYINHPLKVAHILARAKVEDTAILVAAILHDTVEDTETTIDEIERRFGKRIARLVAEVTDDKSLPKAERKRLQILTAVSKSAGAKQIKIADKIANLQDLRNAPPNWSEERMQAYRQFAEDVVAGCSGINDALDEMIRRELAGDLPSA